MPSIFLFLLVTILTSAVLRHSLANKFSAEADSTNPTRLMQRRHLVHRRAILKEKLQSNVHNGYLQWEKDRFHEALGEKILPKSSRILMDPKFLGSVEPRLLKTSADGTRTKDDSEEEKWRDWLRRHLLADRNV